MFHVIHGALFGILVGGFGGALLGYVDASGSIDTRIVVGKLCVAIGCASGGIVGALAGLAAGSSATKPHSPLATRILRVELVILGLGVVFGLVRMVF